jgi:murein DD-endopeptidase MepM/ murein hydrolase activator NlpD
MPTPSRRRHARPPASDRSVHPLANLPRPISERDLGGRRITPLRLTAVAAVIAVAIGGGLTAASIGGAPLDPVGDVAGAARSVSASPSASSPVAAPTSTLSPVPTSRPTPTPVPTPTPLPTPAPVDTLVGYVSPLPRGRLTLPFGPSRWGSRIVGGEQFHDGMDLATFCGDRIVAAHAGTVLAAGRKFDQHLGWIGDLQPYLDRLEAKQLWTTLPIVVVIDDGNGYRSIYAHFRETVVKRGEVVEAGDLLGYEGQTGRASGCHLHYGLFSPLETATFGIDPDVVKRMKVPKTQIARVDPLLVLPMHAPKPKATPTPTPVVTPAPAPTVSAMPSPTR